MKNVVKLVRSDKLGLVNTLVKAYVGYVNAHGNNSDELQSQVNQREVTRLVSMMETELRNYLSDWVKLQCAYYDDESDCSHYAENIDAYDLHMLNVDMMDFCNSVNQFLEVVDSDVKEKVYDILADVNTDLRNDQRFHYPSYPNNDGVWNNFHALRESVGRNCFRLV